MFLRLGPCPASLQPSMDPSSCQALLRHRPKSHSSALSDLDCPLIHQQRIQLRAPIAYAADQRLLLPSGKSDGLVWHSGLSDFSVLEPFCSVGGRHSCNDRLICSTLHGQNPQLVLTILGGSALVVEPMDRNTPPKVNTLSAEAPTAQALVVRSERRRQMMLLLTMIPTF
jgi:hypothetical protein